MSETGYVLVVAPERDAAPTTLFFRGLARTTPAAIRIAQYRHDAMAGLVGGAAAIVFSRGLFEFGDIVSCAALLGIPRYYFLDDHFILVREQGGAAAAFAQAHTQENVQRILRGFSGVLASTPPLRSDLLSRGLHANVMLFPPIAIERMAARQARASARIAFFGGSHLHGVLHSAIVPAIRRVARSRPVTLIAVGVREPIAPSDGLTVERQPYEPSYLDGVRRLAVAGIDVLVHPVASGLLGNPFKNPHALITAYALDAVPVVSNAAPYASLRDAGVAVLCDDGAASWHDGLVTAIDADRTASIRSRLAEHCRHEYDGSVNARVWASLLSQHAAPPAPAAAARTALAAAWLSANWIGRGINRVLGRRAAAV